MEYVLIWMIYIGGSSTTTVATSSQEFNNKSACETAKTMLIQESSRWHGRELKAYCVPKR